MLSKEDIERIEKIIKKQLERVNYLPYSYKDVKSFNLLDYYSDMSFVFTAEDSSFIYGTIGPFSYIFSRAVSINSEGKIIKREYFNIFPYLFINDISISKLAEVISKILEYEVILDNLSEVLLLDGSFEADMILALKNMEKYSYVRNKLSEDLDLINVGTILASRINDLIREGNNGKMIFYFVKRPIDSSKLVRGGINDYIYLTKLFEGNSFFTFPIIREYSNETQKRVFGDLTTSYYFIYYRGSAFSPIYRIEIPNLYEIQDFLKYLAILLRNYSKGDLYPTLLLLSHNFSKISMKEKKFIEEKIKESLPDEFSSKEITYFS